MSIRHKINRKLESSRRWLRVAFASLMLLGATVLAVQEVESHPMPSAEHLVTN